MSSFNQRGCYVCGGPLDGLLCRRCTCEWCGNNLRNGFCSFCASRAGNSFVYDPNPNSFNNPPNVFNHPPQPQTYSCELCGNDSHYGFDCPPRVPLVYEQEPCYNQNFGDNYYPQNSPSFPQQYLCCENCGGPHANFQCQPRNQNFYEPNLCYNSNSSGFDQPPQYSINHQPQSIQEDLNQQRMNDVLKAVQSLVEKLRQQEQAANLSTHTPEPSRRFNFIYDDDDDDEESTIPLNKIISQIPLSIAITLESDKVIKSSVEVLFPIPSESEDTSDNDSECDLPFCDDSFPLDVLGGNSVTFSNPLFESNDDFTSSDDESFPDEDVQEENFKTYLNPLFEFDDKYISSDVNPLFNEVLEDIESKDSYVSNLDEQALLVTHLSELNVDECFDPGGDEIEACLTSDSIPPGIDGADFDPEGDIFLREKLLNDDISFSLPLKELHFEEGDIIYLESLLIKDTIPNLLPEVFLDYDPKSLNNEPNIDDLKIKENVRITFEDRHYLSLTFIIKIFLPFLTYLVNSLPLLSSGSEDTIFDPGISAYSFYSLEPVAYESPMTIFPFFCFSPKNKGI
ncbi:hypothetical protein Tco_0728159 [Tanacetum coccineum]|uniref:CCHC-type domain-containing protein n=1 Tax=Tanacetum coccineum TaxID=301880 RepID=A0ABQ4YNI7_9ASTR